MARPSVPFGSVVVNAAQVQSPPVDEVRRSNTSPGARDRKTDRKIGPGGPAVPAATTERLPPASADGVEPDWSSTTDAATD
jgi:hypothetical protein